MALCQYCGARIEDTDLFCTMCGKPTPARSRSKASSQATPQGAVGVMPVRPQASGQGAPRGAVGVKPVQTRPVSQVIPERTVSAPPPQVQVSVPSNSEQTRSKLLLPAILLATALCGVAVAFFLRGNGTGAGGAAPAPLGGTAEGAATPFAVTFLSGGAGEGTTSPFTCSEGDTITLPNCGFVREGYTFECWEDDAGHQYAPGAQIVVDGDISFSAVWTTATDDSEVESIVDEGGTADSDSEVETVKDANGHTVSFPRYWAGTFEGYSQHVEGGTYDTSVKFVFSTIESSGRLAGTCYIGQDDSEGRVGSYLVEGYVDWVTGEITLSGTTWEDQGDLEYMRSFSGTVDSSHTSITGTSQRTDGTHQGDWSMQAY